MKQTTRNVILCIVACLIIYKYYLSRSVNQEGFTQLLYSRIRPQARSARLYFEETIENGRKHIDRIKYNLGMR